MSTQTPPEKMTLEQTKQKFADIIGCQSLSGIKLLSGELLLFQSALSHLEGAQADTKRMDWLESSESTGFERWSTGWGFHDHRFQTLRDAIDSEMPAMAAQTEGERP